MPKQRRPVDPRLKGQSVDLAVWGAVGDFVNAISDGSDKPDCNQIACIGCRGDGKTIGAMVGMIAHAQKHSAMGYPLPVHWMGVTDTFTSHKLKTIRSFENPLWKGGWKMTEQDHVATFWAGNPPIPMVQIDLFGIEDQGAKDRVRMETTGVWFEEPAPTAVMVQSSGVDEDSWNIAMTSQRIPSHFKPAIITENYPDEDHWTWRNFVEMELPGTRYFRVPPGERASAEDRATWEKALANRPDLLRRLLQGLPGVVMLGDQVAQGFTRQEHTTRERKPLIRDVPLYFGFDFGHTPTVVIGQPWKGCMRIYAALHLKGAGMRQLMEDMLIPWLSRYAPFVLRNPSEYALIGYDPAQGTEAKPKGSEADIENTAIQVIKDYLDGWLEPGPVQWDLRRNILLQIFQRAHGVIVEEGEFTLDLIRALDGRWYYAKSHQGELRSDSPKKPNHPWEDLGDAFVYLLYRYGIGALAESVKPLKVITNLTNDDSREYRRDHLVVRTSGDKYE